MYVAKAYLHMSLKEYGHLRFGTWVDLFEVHKKQKNFETNRGLYKLDELPKVDSLDLI